MLEDERIAKQRQTRRDNIANGKTIIYGHRHSEETKKLLSEKQKAWLRANPDRHVWKRSTKFKSAPCEYLKSILSSLGIVFVEEYCPFVDSAISLDIAFPDISVGVEVNGNQHYNADGSLKAYYQKRHDKLVAAGWKIYELHYTLCYNIKNLTDILEQDVYNRDYVEKHLCLKEIKKATVNKATTEQRQPAVGKKRSQQIEQRRQLILKSGINFAKLGWVEQVSKLFGTSHTNSVKWLKLHMPEFYASCYIRKRPKS